jgi:hypothetical protein
MIRKFLKLIGIILVGAIALGLGFLISQPQDRLFSRKNREAQQPRIIIPRETEMGDLEFDSSAERMAYEDSVSTKIALKDGEIMIAVLNQDFDGDPAEEQIIAYRNLLEKEGPVYLAYVDYDEAGRVYRRAWNAPTAVTRPGTLSLSTQDLIGDRSVCVLATGMENQGAHTLTVFRKVSPGRDGGEDEPFKKIAELRIDGSIRVQETERPQSYQLGISRGMSFPIVAYGHDFESENILDQVEILYAYNPDMGQYVESKITRVPGSQIEQRRLKELLSGVPGVFEEFIHDLWYFVGPEGTLDSRQYIYFDPASREIIFFGDGAQQVFVWQNSSPTRYGLYVASQNISVTTLRRTIDIELESLNSIRVKVFEDVRLKIRADNTWDGSYRRAGSAEKSTPSDRVLPYLDARYDSSLGRIRFAPDGHFEIGPGETMRRGRYAFFDIENQRALELRPLADPRSNQENDRETYRVESSGDNLILSRIRIGARGIQDLHEPAITLSPAAL